MGFQPQPGMMLADAARLIGPLIGVPPDQIAGFVLLVVVDDDGGPAIAASDNIPPAMAADLMLLAGEMLARSERERLMN